MLQLLQIRHGEVLADLACGAGGPSLWMAAQSGASLIGIDPSPAGLRLHEHARVRRALRDEPVSSRAPSSRPAFPVKRPTP